MEKSITLESQTTRGKEGGEEENKERKACHLFIYLFISFDRVQLQRAIDLADKMGLACKSTFFLGFFFSICFVLFFSSAVVCLQPQYNLLCRAVEWDLLPVCQQNKIGVIPWSPLVCQISFFFTQELC
jgi:hypothetical protein